VHFDIGDVARVVLQPLDDQKLDFRIGPQGVFAGSRHGFDQGYRAFLQGAQHDAAGTAQFVPGKGAHDQRHTAGQSGQIAGTQHGGLRGIGVAAAEQFPHGREFLLNFCLLPPGLLGLLAVQKSIWTPVEYTWESVW